MGEELAIKGGPRAVPEGSIKTWPPLLQQDRDAVMAVFDSNVLHGNNAPQCTKLQEEWAAFCGAKHCIVVNSGTAALHAAVAGVGVEPGDEVIVPAFTYWSSAAAVIHHNAIPVFVDIDPVSYCIDPAAIEPAISEHTKAVMPVHIHGMVCDMDPINEVAKAHGLKVVEDACQAHGAEYKGRRTGSLGDAAGFSTNRSKNLSGGEGGMVTMDDEGVYNMVRLLREFGENVISYTDREYDAQGLGWNYRPHEFISAFVRSQLTRLEEHNRLRREFAKYLTGQLAQIPGVEGPPTPDYANPCYFSYVVTFCPDQLGLDMPVKDFKEKAQKALAAEGVGLGQWQKMPVPAQGVFQKKRGYGKGCPWTCAHGRDIAYNGDDYPKTWDFIHSHAYLTAVYPPNEMKLMECYVKGFQKVMSQPDAWLG